MDFNFRKYGAIGGTVACALGIGFIMQYGREVPTESASFQQPAEVRTSAEPANPVPVAAQADPASQQEKALQTTAENSATEQPEAEQIVSRNMATHENTDLNLGDVALTAASRNPELPRVLPELPKRPRPVPGAPRESSATAPVTPTDPATPRLGCAIEATATEAAAATVHLTVEAACYPNERITVHHNGMMFTASTDEDGQFSADIPALAANAVFIVAFSNGKGAAAQAHVASISAYDRVALQWSGTGEFQIHAREYGAGYGDQGHVWSGSDRTSADADNGTGGYVARLGDAETLAPQFVEIYTFPANGADKAGTVKMSVESEVSDANCGRDVSAQVLELRSGAKLKTRDLIVSVPDCDAVGDFLVLNNLVDDLKVAGR